jgi:hypothetical protein
MLVHTKRNFFTLAPEKVTIATLRDLGRDSVTFGAFRN